MLVVGAVLGISASLVGLSIFIAGCFGLASFMFSPLPLLLGLVGLILTIVGATTRKGRIEDAQILASMFVNFIAIVGALLELAAWNGWTVLPKAG